MSRLTDTQTILLSTAAARPDGGVLPAPETLKVKGASMERALKALLRQGLIARAGTARRGRTGKKANGQSENSLGERLIITAAGLDAICVEPGDEDEGSAGMDATSVAGGPERAEMLRPGGKLGLMLNLISAPRGATLDELAAQSGWLRHTTRAALTRLRQRGFDIQLTVLGDRRAYRLNSGA